MHTNKCVYLNIYLSIYLSTYLPTQLSIYPSIYLSICVCAHTYSQYFVLCIPVKTNARNDVYIYIYVCVCVRVYIYTHIYIYMPNKSIYKQTSILNMCPFADPGILTCSHSCSNPWYLNPPLLRMKSPSIQYVIRKCYGLLPYLPSYKPIVCVVNTAKSPKGNSNFKTSLFPYDSISF